jgi:hypothetical protein
MKSVPDGVILWFGVLRWRPGKLDRHRSAPGRDVARRRLPSGRGEAVGRVPERFVVFQ